MISCAYITPERRFTLQVYGHMFRARLSRLYPSYLVICAVTVMGAVLCARFGIGTNGDFPFKAIPVRLALMQTWPGLTWAMRPWTGPLWFLSAIWFAYLFMFPCAWLLIRKLRSTWAILFWVCAPGRAVRRLAIPSLHEFHIVLRSSGGFICGSALFALYSKRGAVLLAAQKHLDKLVVLFIGATALLPLLPSSAAQQIVNLLLLLGAPVVMAGMTGGSSLTTRLLSIRPLAWLASISFAIYLTHYQAESILHVVLPMGRFTNSPLLVKALVGAVYLAVVLVSAIALNRLVELPCAKALKNFSFTRGSRDL